jgi:hypothetical protein
MTLGRPFRPKGQMVAIEEAFQHAPPPVAQAPTTSEVR